ncbi:hypothetical protein GSI_14907 [Ganoderma sinense ZZ0214-1]|uniref:Transporter n=1 Tax=Ganoderma sinense ZZ0214-1 TaxID=1077348 RepID=A0A2G8RQ03_9APHY|nr:hypothetical protein GSI_14907 [Ganoderma sinense ZZ0214-1]
MHLSPSFAAALVLVLTLGTVSLTTPVSAPSSDEAATVGADELAPYHMSHEEMMHWIANTDAKLTFIGEPINPLIPRSAQVTTVTYCNTRVLNVCGGSCTVYTGGTTCLNAPNTACLAATFDVAFCNGAQCTGTCSDLYNCSVRMSDGFCAAPTTVAIFVGGAQ